MQKTKAVKGFAAILVLCAIPFGISGQKFAPGNVLVYADPVGKVFFTPGCLSPERVNSLLPSTLGEAVQHNFNLDSKCKDQGELFQEDRSLGGSWLQKIGILRPLKSRWNSDGTWNW